MKPFSLNAATAIAVLINFHAAADEWKSGIEWPEPAVVVPGKTNNAPPSDAIVLFDGTNLDQWDGAENWEIKRGMAIPGGGSIFSKQRFGDIQLHIEWSAPPKIEGSGQGRGNSGVFFMGRYEVQILDSYQNPTYFDGQAGAVYKQTPPMVNAMRRPGQWNTYDTIFTAPTFGVDTRLTRPAYVTVIHNGIVVQNHFQIFGHTWYHKPPHYEPHPPKEPIKLQFHKDAVRFRNIWVRELKPVSGQRTSGPYYLKKD